MKPLNYLLVHKISDFVFENEFVTENENPNEIDWDLILTLLTTHFNRVMVVATEDEIAAVRGIVVRRLTKRQAGVHHTY